MIATNNYWNGPGNNRERNEMISSCGYSGSNQHQNKDQQETKYHCPMNCEGNKTYNQPGECPVCNMQLVITGIDAPKINVE